MARYAFPGTPAQAAHLADACPAMASDGVHGLAEGWDAAFAIWRARRGFDADYAASPHGTLSLILDGAEVERLDGRWAGRRGGPDPQSFILYPAGGGTRRYAARGDVRICQIYFQPALLLAAAATGGTVRDADGLELRDDRIFARDRQLRLEADRYVARGLDRAEPPSLLEMDTRALLLAALLLGRHSGLSPPAGAPAAPRGALDSRRLRIATEHIEAHLDRQVPLAELAAAVGLTPRHLCSAFRLATGEPPHRYLVARRVERAKSLLAAGTAPISEVALACGFASQQHLTTVFRRLTGVTPAAWRAIARG